MGNETRSTAITKEEKEELRKVISTCLSIQGNELNLEEHIEHCDAAESWILDILKLNNPKAQEEDEDGK